MEAQKAKVGLGTAFLFIREDQVMARCDEHGNRIMWDIGDDKQLVPWMNEQSFRQFVNMLADCLGCTTSPATYIGRNGRIMRIELIARSANC